MFSWPANRHLDCCPFLWCSTMVFGPCYLFSTISTVCLCWFRSLLLLLNHAPVYSSVRWTKTCFCTVLPLHFYLSGLFIYVCSSLLTLLKEGRNVSHSCSLDVRGDQILGKQDKFMDGNIILFHFNCWLSDLQWLFCELMVFLLTLMCGALTCSNSIVDRWECK